MSDLQELTNELMQDETFRDEFEALQPEMDIKETGASRAHRVRKLLAHRARDGRFSVSS